MPIYHMETDSTRAMAIQMRHAADSIRQQLSNLQPSAYSADWQGPSRDEFVMELERLEANMAALVETGNMLSYRVDTEILEWESLDSSFTQGYTQDSSLIAAIAVGLIIFSPLINPPKVIAPSPFPLAELGEFVNDTPAGKDLIEQAKKAGLGFRLDDGTILGDPNGELVEVSFGDTDKNVLGYQSGNKIVISQNNASRYDQETLGPTLAHEMQHALDMKQGLKVRNAYDGVEAVANDPAKLEEFLSDRIGRRVASEVRAFERGEAVQQNKNYVDDGLTSSAEAKAIFDRGYKAKYESEIDDIDVLKDRYDVYYYFDKGTNTVRAKVTQIK